jgi:hypothetical protein
MGHGRAAKSAVLFLAFDRCAFVVLLFAVGDADFDFRPAVLEIDRQRNQRDAARGGFVFQPFYFAAMGKEFALAQRFVADVGFFVWIDVAAVQNQFAVFDSGEGFGQLAFSEAQGFHFAAEERDAAFEFGGDEIIVHRLAVVDARIEVGFGPASHGCLSYRQMPRSASRRG